MKTFFGGFFMRQHPYSTRQPKLYSLIPYDTNIMRNQFVACNNVQLDINNNYIEFLKEFEQNALQQYQYMVQFVNQVRESTQQMPECDTKDFAMELVDDCESWTDSWKLATDIAASAIKAFSKAGSIIHDETMTIINVTRKLGQKSIQRAIKNSRRILQTIKKYQIDKSFQQRLDELAHLINIVEDMVANEFSLDQNFMKQLSTALDEINSWHKVTLNNIKSTGELDTKYLETHEIQMEEYYERENKQSEPGAQNIDVIEGNCDSHIEMEIETPGALDKEDNMQKNTYASNAAIDDMYASFNQVDSGFEKLFESIQTSQLYWKWVRRVVQSINLIGFVAILGVGFLKSTVIDASKRQTNKNYKSQ